MAVMLLSVVAVLSMPNVYKSQALLAPNEDAGASGLAALASQYGGLASLAGIDLGGGSTNKSDLGIEVLKSRKFITEFIKRHQLLVPLMASDGWDAESGELKIDSSLYDESANKWIRDVSPPYKTVPSDQEAYEEFAENILSVTKNRQTGFVTVSVEHYSPSIASEWANLLIRDLNQTSMRHDVDEAEQAIEYLNTQSQTISHVDLRSVFFGLIEEQTKTVMLAKVSDEYLFRVLDPAVPSERLERPKRLQIVAVITLLAGALWLILVVLIASKERTE